MPAGEGNEMSRGIFMNAYEIPDAIQWTEGLLLTPSIFSNSTSGTKHWSNTEHRCWRHFVGEFAVLSLIASA
jgi:hypothetical protein